MEIAGLQLVLDCPTAAAATSAAAIWGLEMLAPPPAELVLVTADGVVHGERRDDYVLRAAELPAHHLRERFGVRLTSAARTVVDLARAGTLAEGVVVADSALRRGQVSKGELEAMLHDCARWPGIGRAGQVLKLADPKAESVLESVSRVSMHEQHLPAPRTQVVLCSEHGEPCGRVDFFWEESGVIGEADGVGKYDAARGRSTRDIVRAEKRREERLADLGYEIVR